MNDSFALREDEQNDATATIDVSNSSSEIPEVQSTVIPIIERVAIDLKKSTQTGSKEADMSFTLKLYDMLEKTEDEGLASVVSWQPHGRCFKIHEPKEFDLKVLPSWFKNLDFSSFQRELELYGFKRVTSGRDKGGYYNNFFRRQQRSLGMLMKRQKGKEIRNRTTSTLGQEPNFYMMLFQPTADYRKTNLPKKPLLVMDPC